MRKQSHISAPLLLAAMSLCFLLAGQSTASTLFLHPSPDARVRAGAVATLPVYIEGARDLGALQFDLVFDGELMEVVEVTAGASMPPVLLDFHVVQPGLLRVALAGSEAVDEDTRLDVQVRGVAAGSTALTVQNAQAWELSTGYDLLIQTRPGQLTVTGGLPISGLLIAAVVALVLLAGLGLLLLLRKRKPRSIQAPPESGGDAQDSSPGPPMPPAGPPPPPSMTAQPPSKPKTWYQARAGERYGPYDEQQFAALAREGNVLPSDLVWTETMTEWVRADSIKGLLSGSATDG
ncbi:MAG: GYF domain-containing protein [Candidatus Krumholzibacteriia bacterium]